MKVIEAGGNLSIYTGERIKTYDKIPTGIYKVRFSKMQGFWLEESDDLKINEDKIYGIHEKKVDKVLNSFLLFNKNLGVILSGNKGIGKSLFAKMLGIKVVEKGYPLIIVNEYYPGITEFISSIDQEVALLFDEFEKTFAETDTCNPQHELLTLLDGLENGKKLFIVTCNDLYKMDDCMLNRPGRFHYHFRFEYPNAYEIREYLEDKLDEKYYKEIENVIKFSYRVSLNYDCLRAIAFELNSGETFRDAIRDLNIIDFRANSEYCKIEMKYRNGEVFESGYAMREFTGGTSGEFITLQSKRNEEYLDKIEIYTDNNCLQFDFNQLVMYINPEDIEIEETDIDEDRKNIEALEEYYNEKRNIEYIHVKKRRKDNYRYDI